MALRTPHLTFDDGPSEWTLPLLEILRAHGVRATFFVIGAKARQRPEVVQAAARDGHRIENHTEDHAALSLLEDDEEVAARLRPTSDLVEELTGRRPTLFRPPFGLTNEHVVAVGASLGIEQMLWTIDSHDYEGIGADRIAAAVAEAGENDVVLLHDGCATANPCERRATLEGVRMGLALLRAPRS